MTPDLHALDRARLQQALELAQRAIGLSDPNPRVGCVIGTDDGHVLGTGSTQAAGLAHAEAAALQDVAERGLSARGATAWVTLEPCAHHGRTPPCCDALIAAGVQRVVVALADPFPAVNGQGMARLRAAGISVTLADADLAKQAAEINIGFFSRVQRGRPWVRLKLACSLDGQAALADGSSRWITSAAARADGHAWRRRAGAIVTGIGTVLADDPRLDVREVPTHTQPLRVVLDRAARTPSTARLLQAPGHALVLTAAAHRAALATRLPPGTTVSACAETNKGLDLNDVLRQLAEREINEVHVEAGPMLSGAWLSSGLVDEALVYMAPKLLGPGLAMARLPALAALTEAAHWHFVESHPIGPDLRLRLRPGMPSPSGTQETWM